MSKKAKIYYHDIGDYLNRDEKLKIVKQYKDPHASNNTNKKILSNRMVVKKSTYLWGVQIQQIDNIFKIIASMLNRH